ncbi:AAA family ATPase [Corynebacterium sp. P7003]|uniref:AAA family ATPase n=1 Tax=Corynebacterium pygosceleis TaxID=2800406 RepID=A0ABT3WUP6_9CORY|nr:AAA family ATPase [Corynebacterium pygosceleis]MCX7444517.1 AAA family ATPase [Corynebacterium pygosceleis]
MRIHSIIIDNVRGIDHLELTDLPDTGLIVISGDNEQGKSTVLESVRTVLTVPHSSGRREVRALQPVGQDVAPRIELAATVGPCSFTVTKTYLRQKSAVLTVRCPRPENLTGREAEDRLTAILDEYLDTALMDVLFVRQGELDAAVSAAGVPSLARALGDSGAPDTGEDPQVGEEEQLLRRVEQEYERYYTAARGTETGELRAAREAAASASTELDEATAEVERLAGYVEEVRRRSAEEAAARARRPDAVRERAELRETAKRAERAESRVTAAENTLTAATATLEASLGRMRRRKELVAQVAAMEAEVGDLTRARVELADAATREQSRIDELQVDLAAAEDDLSRATELVESRERRHRETVASARRRELAGILGELDDLDGRTARLREYLAGNTVTEPEVTDAENAELELKLALGRRDAASATVALTAVEATPVTVDGETVTVDGEERSYDVTEPVTLTTGGVTAVITPGAGIEGANADVNSARQALDALLRAMDCPDVDTARKRLEEHRTRQRELDTLRRERQATLAGRDEQALRHEMTALGAPAEPDTEPEPDTDASGADIEAAKTARDEAGNRVDLLRARLSAQSERRARGALAVHDAKMESARAALRRAEDALGGADPEDHAGTADDADLDTLIAAQTEARESAAAELATAVGELEKTNPELTGKLLRGAETQVSSIDETIRLAERAVAENRGRIEQATGAEERLEKATSAERRARENLASTLRRAEAVRRLREVLHRHRDDARRRYAEPFSRRLTTMAAAVFGPDVRFGLTEELAVADRTLGRATVDVDSLSGGAREQIGVLVRLSIAELVGQDGGVPVFIDDALGSTDSERLRRMATVLADAGENGQVFVLTCVPSRYDRVPGRTHLTMSELRNRRDTSPNP